MSEMKSFSTCRRDELFDQLLNSIEEQIWGSTKEGSYRNLPLYLTIESRRVEKEKGDFEPIPQSILALTRPRRANERPRLVSPGMYREWAMNSENWARLIPEAKMLLLECARERNDTEFLDKVQWFERRAK